VVNIYDWNTVKESVSCIRYLNDCGIEVSAQGRCHARWRGGVSKDSVHVEERVWHDFVSGAGGSVIDLCAINECNGDRLVALRVLGDRYNVQPKSTARKAVRTRGETLVAEGYELKVTYPYCNADGEPIYFVDRYEHPEKGKTFVQRTKDHDGLKDVEKTIYNLPAVIKSQEVFIVEGEKDVETMRGMNLVATTNSGGGTYWEVKFNAYFKDKDVIIIPDNDETGINHGNSLYSMLRPIAKSVKLITISSLPKGDVTDWMEKEGGSVQKLREIVDAHMETATADSPDVALAKQLNATPFSNYLEDGKKNLPKTIGALVSEVKERFLGFPRIIGDQLFDYDKDAHEIRYLLTKNDLFAWIQGTSGQPVNWCGGEGFVTRDELFSRIFQTAVRYEGVSCAPHYPTRSDVFYTFGKLPPPDPSHSTFWELVDRFNPASPANRLLIAAFLIAPMWFDRENRAPLFVVDTDDAQSSGKTTLVEIVSSLYGQEPLMLDFGLLERDINQVNRRLLSASARQKRVALFDNLTRKVSCDNLAQLVTSKSISGIAPYGRGEMTRPNDLVYAVTVNGASVDTDTATRAYTIRLKKPEKLRAEWRDETIAFIDRNRLQLYSDIIHMMQNAQKRERNGRFGKFDITVLSAVCADDAEFALVDRSIRAEADRANDDADRGAEFLEMIYARVSSEVDNFDANRPFVMRNADINFYLAHSSGNLKTMKVQAIRSLVKQGQIPPVSKYFDRLPQGDTNGRFHGMFFGVDRMPEGGDFTDAQIIVYSQLKKKLTLSSNMLIRQSSVVKPEIVDNSNTEDS